MLIQRLLSSFIGLLEIERRLQLVPEIDVRAFLLPEHLIVVECLRLPVGVKDLAHPREYRCEPCRESLLIILDLARHHLLGDAVILIVVALIVIFPESVQVDVLLDLYLKN